MVALDRLQLALRPALLRPALVIVVHLPRLTGAALSVQHGATISTKAFTAQQIVHLRPPCCIVPARFEVSGGLVEGRLVDDRLGGDLHALDLKAAQVLLVPKHPIDHGLGDRAATPAGDPALPEELDQLLRLGSGDVHPEGLTDDGSLFLVDYDVPVLVYRVPDRKRLAAILALLRGLPHAPEDLLPQVRAVILGQAFQHALQDDPLRALRNGFLGVHEADACLLQLHLRDGNVLAIPAEAVDLPDDHALEAMLLRVVQHPLELVPADDALPGDVPVGIDLHDLDPVPLSIRPAVGHLALDRLVCLVRPVRVSGINRADHFRPSRCRIARIAA